jgi:hypothetical protein
MIGKSSLIPGLAVRNAVYLRPNEVVPWSQDMYIVFRMFFGCTRTFVIFANQCMATMEETIHVLLGLFGNEEDIRLYHKAQDYIPLANSQSILEGYKSRLRLFCRPNDDFKILMRFQQWLLFKMDKPEFIQQGIGFERITK